MLTLTFTIAAKVETLRLDGVVVYMFHGGLLLTGSEAEPLNLALTVPEEVWLTHSVGDVVAFEAKSPTLDTSRF